MNFSEIPERLVNDVSPISAEEAAELEGPDDYRRYMQEVGWGLSLGLAFHGGPAPPSSILDPSIGKVLDKDYVVFADDMSDALYAFHRKSGAVAHITSDGEVFEESSSFIDFVRMRVQNLSGS